MTIQEVNEKFRFGTFGGLTDEEFLEHHCPEILKHFENRFEDIELDYSYEKQYMQDKIDNLSSEKAELATELDDLKNQVTN